MPRIELAAIAPTNRTGYPVPFADAVAGRWYRRLAPAAALTQMGASHVTLAPSAWSSQRHWHRGEDELLIMLSGEAVLIEGADGAAPVRTTLRPGDVCAWAAGVAAGHRLVNESDADCVFVAISAGPDKGGWYSDIDMQWLADGRYVTKDGRDYAATTPAAAGR